MLSFLSLCMLRVDISMHFHSPVALYTLIYLLTIDYYIKLEFQGPTGPQFQGQGWLTSLTYSLASLTNSLASLNLKRGLRPFNPTLTLFAHEALLKLEGDTVQ